MPDKLSANVIIYFSVPLVLILIYLCWRGIKPLVPRKCWAKLFLFGITGSVFSFSGYVCIEYLPLGSAGALDHAVWMLMVPFTSRMILNEKTSKVQWIAIILATAGSALIFIGLVITVDFHSKLKEPDVLTTSVTDASTLQYETVSDNFLNFSYGNWMHQDHYRTRNISDFVFGLSLAFITGISGSLCIAFSKFLQDYLETPVVLAVWYNTFGMIICGLFMFMFEVNDLAIPFDFSGWAYLSLHVFSNVGISITFYLATYYASAILCNITFNLEIPLRILCQYVIFTSLQPIDGSLYDLIGGMIITLAVFLPSVYDFTRFLAESKSQTKDEGYRLIGKSDRRDSIDLE